MHIYKNYMFLRTHYIYSMSHTWRWASSLWQDKKWGGLRAWNEKHQRLKLHNTTTTQHLELSCSISRVWFYIMCETAWGSFNPDILGRNIHRNITTDPYMLINPSYVSTAWAEECKQQHSLIFKAPRYVDRWQSNPKHRDRSGTGRGNQRDHKHTADQITQQKQGEEREVEGGDSGGR